MKKRNRILSVLLCAAMVAGLAGCGSKNDSEDSGEKDGKIKLTFSTSVYVEEPHQKAIDALLEAYNKKRSRFWELVMMDIGIILPMRFSQERQVT